MHSSINHLDELACKDLHRNNKSRVNYMNLVRKLYDITNNNGIVLISDCTRYTIWSLLGLKNPLSPSINYEIHQSPKT